MAMQPMDKPEMAAGQMEGDTMGRMMEMMSRMRAMMDEMMAMMQGANPDSMWDKAKRDRQMAAQPGGPMMGQK